MWRITDQWKPVRGVFLIPDRGQQSLLLVQITVRHTHDEVTAWLQHPEPIPQSLVRHLKMFKTVRRVDEVIRLIGDPVKCLSVTITPIECTNSAERSNEWIITRTDIDTIPLTVFLEESVALTARLCFKCLSHWIV